MRQRYLMCVYLLACGFILLSSKIQAQISADAIKLTLKMQDGIFLDSTLAYSIDSSLAIARTANDSLQNINIWPPYIDKTIEILTTASWCSAWKQKEILTGEPYIDSLGLQYGLTRIDPLPQINYYYLGFKYPLQLSRLANLYSKHKDIQYAKPNGSYGDGDRIYYFKKNGKEYFVFSHGWGDCPAGCTERNYWYVIVNRLGSQGSAILEEGKYYDYSPYIFRWNIPGYYSMTMFPSADSILSTVQNGEEWWIRRHAIEGIKRFFMYNSPWLGGDDAANTGLWNTLKSQLMSRQSEVESVLRFAHFDPDPDVRASADTALARIHTVGVTEELPPGKFELFQNYPNPFNPSTQILFYLEHESFVSLIVYNILGQEVAHLIREKRDAGTHRAVWIADKFPAGVYFYRLYADGTAQSRKMLLLK